VLSLKGSSAGYINWAAHARGLNFDLVQKFISSMKE
jgi:gamma-glutamylcysteine synthetase